jgi:hypothetical protein
VADWLAAGIASAGAAGTELAAPGAPAVAGVRSERLQLARPSALRLAHRKYFFSISSKSSRVLGSPVKIRQALKISENRRYTN